MCFYERIDFLCGDHRWGTMRQQCPREYRTGESCRGVKLSHDDYINKVDKRCHVCEALEIKERKYHKEFSSLMRWQEQHKQQGKKITASANKWVFRFVSHPDYDKGDKSFIGKLLPEMLQTLRSQREPPGVLVQSPHLHRLISYHPATE